MLRALTDLPEEIFGNVVWHSLQTAHHRFASCTVDACRYPADMAPFAAVRVPSANALQQLQTLLLPGESVWIMGESYPPLPGLVFEETLDCLQMVLPQEIILPKLDPAIVILPLTEVHASQMVALTDIAFPGFFRRRTCEMGSYYGVRRDRTLIAMGGERLLLEGYPEISGVCTHPQHRGQGLAEAIIWHMIETHRRDGLVSWLHVTAGNHRAIALYLRMGFHVVRRVTLHRISRQHASSDTNKK